MTSCVTKYFSFLLGHEAPGQARSLLDQAGSLARAVGMSECGQMAICDAHYRTSDYGILALPLLFFFPG